MINIDSLKKICEEKYNINFHDIKDFESHLMNYPQVEMPLCHRFLDGIYAREIKMDKGTIVTSKIHKTENISIISQGSVLDITEQNNIRLLTAPHTMIVESGTKRILFVLEDTIWTTIHKNSENDTDLDILESKIIEEELDVKRFQSSKKLNLEVG